MTDWRRLCEKLRDAADAVADEERPIRERLKSAYVYGLSGLVAEDFPDENCRREFAAIEAALSARDEVFEGEGSVSTTAFVMGDAEAEALRDRIVALSARYCEDQQ